MLRYQPVAATCTHLDTVHLDVTPSSDVGCSECLKTGDRWMHLRLCLECGQVGCCDSSPNKHASKHAAADHHPVVASFEPGEDWCWCYEDQLAFELEGYAPPSHG